MRAHTRLFDGLGCRRTAGAQPFKPGTAGPLGTGAEYWGLGYPHRQSDDRLPEALSDGCGACWPSLPTVYIHMMHIRLAKGTKPEYCQIPSAGRLKAGGNVR